MYIVKGENGFFFCARYIWIFLLFLFRSGSTFIHYANVLRFLFKVITRKLSQCCRHLRILSLHLKSEFPQGSFPHYNPPPPSSSVYYITSNNKIYVYLFGGATTTKYKQKLMLNNFAFSLFTTAVDMLSHWIGWCTKKITQVMLCVFLENPRLSPPAIPTPFEFWTTATTHQQRVISPPLLVPKMSRTKIGWKTKTSTIYQDYCICFSMMRALISQKNKFWKLKGNVKQRFVPELYITRYLPDL